MILIISNKYIALELASSLHPRNNNSAVNGSTNFSLNMLMLGRGAKTPQL